jgi:hypothetical protein
MSPSPSSSDGVQHLVAKVRETATRSARRAHRALKDPSGAAQSLRGRRQPAPAAKVASKPATTPKAAATRRLTPAEALRENGFVVFRGVVMPDECARLARTLRDDAGIEDMVKFTRVDATEKFPSTRKVLFDERILSRVRSAISDKARFLQVSDDHSELADREHYLRYVRLRDPAQLEPLFEEFTRAGADR